MEKSRMTIAAKAMPSCVMRSALLLLLDKTSGATAQYPAGMSSTPLGFGRRHLDGLRDALARQRQHLAGKNAGGMQHLLLAKIAEGELADEIIGARLIRHAADLLADAAGRAHDAAAVLHHGFEIIGDAGIARLGAVHVPELHEALEEMRPGAAAELHRFAIGVGADDEAVDADERQLLWRMAGRGPFGAVAVGYLAYARDRSTADNVDAVLRRPCRAFRHRHRVPQRWMRRLCRLQVDRHVLVAKMRAGKIDLFPGQRLHDHLIGLDIHRLREVVIDAEIVELLRRGAAADADLHPP